MTYDAREAILTHLKDVTLASVTGLAEVDGVTSIFRNRGAVPDTYRPALVLLDGREEKRTTTQGHHAMPSALITIVPQIWVLVKARENVNNDTLGGEPNPVGEELSAWRMKVLGAIFSEAEEGGELARLLGESGEIEYRGLDTDLEAMAEMTGEMHLLFGFTYYFNPRDTY